MNQKDISLRVYLSHDACCCDNKTKLYSYIIQLNLIDKEIIWGIFLWKLPNLAQIEICEKKKKTPRRVTILSFSNLCV